MKKLKSYIGVLLLMAAPLSFADDSKSEGLSDAETKTAAEAIAEYWKANKKDQKLTKESLMSVMDEMSEHVDLRKLVAKQAKIKDLDRIEYLESSAMPGWTSFLVDGGSGGSLVFVSNDKKYLITDAVDIETGRSVSDLVHDKIFVKRVARLEAIPSDSFITFPAEGAEKATITVFVDAKLPYTAKLHREVPKLNKEGITVRYGWFTSGSKDSMKDDLIFATAWGAKGKYNKRKLWDAVIDLYVKSGGESDGTAVVEVSKKTGISIPSPLNPKDKVNDLLSILMQQNALARYTGITGTPHLVIDNGETVSGYRSADAIINYFKEQGILKE